MSASEYIGDLFAVLIGTVILGIIFAITGWTRPADPLFAGFIGALFFYGLYKGVLVKGRGGA